MSTVRVIAHIALWIMIGLTLTVVFALGFDQGIGYVNDQITERIYEDDPGWDCATMGNRICGPESA